MDTADGQQETYDVVVVGTGGGGLVGGYIAASRGLRTLVIEKTDLVGGTTAYSGAGLWLPCNPALKRAGVEDSVDRVRTYLRATIDDTSREALQDAYIDAGPKLIGELERNLWFQWFQYGAVPDYYGSYPGASVEQGRVIYPPDVRASELGDHAAVIRPPLYTERWGMHQGAILTGGQALIGRALMALLETGYGSLRLNTALTSLVVEDGTVVGIDAVSEGRPVRFLAKRGVILAAGGFERNRELRQRYQAPLTGEWSNGAPGNTGDALLAGMAIGAATDMLDEAWFVPGVVQPDGLPIFHAGTRGGVWVNAAGERFMNETAPYDQAGHEIWRCHTTTGVSHIPTYWIFDQRQLDRDGFGGMPGYSPDPSWLESGALLKADSLDDLARLIGVPGNALHETVEEVNAYAQSGVDPTFHRGESAWDQFFFDLVGYPYLPRSFPAKPTIDWPNPLILPIDKPPFYAATVVLSDIGTKGGLKTDESARVLRSDGQAIRGLYAAGNTMAAMSGRVYPGAGVPIGSSLTFAYLAALDLAGA